MLTHLLTQSDVENLRAKYHAEAVKTTGDKFDVWMEAIKFLNEQVSTSFTRRAEESRLRAKARLN